MTPCKICGSNAELHGVVDRAKSCEAHRGRYFRLRREPVWYHRCGSCGFLFTADFDDWTPDDWRREVYNDGYGQVDPDGAWVRPRGNVDVVRDYAHKIGARRILDYGGGDGLLARLLCEAWCDAKSFDVLCDRERPGGVFDLVTSFEVFEHTPTPVETCRDALSFVGEGGSFLFSTLLHDNVAPQDISSWYISPANGHVSIHTTRSLGVMFGGLGWGLEHLGPGLHVGRRVDDK
jgi:hypothetical protein